MRHDALRAARRFDPAARLHLLEEVVPVRLRVRHAGAHRKVAVELVVLLGHVEGALIRVVDVHRILGRVAGAVILSSSGLEQHAKGIPALEHFVKRRGHAARQPKHGAVGAPSVAGVGPHALPRFAREGAKEVFGERGELLLCRRGVERHLHRLGKSVRRVVARVAGVVAHRPARVRHHAAGVAHERGHIRILALERPIFLRLDLVIRPLALPEATIS
mmetsp:Transcript_10766/g.35628  ORF Transcript_10766/g.35628 Transcript_10766/m.35628 type:complete len:218 (+) Transcript_10766:259-912(+)